MSALTAASTQAGGEVEWLYAMGMSRDALSPGLDGFARSLADFHPVAHREQQK